MSTVYRYDAVNRVSLASERPASLASPVCPDAGSHWCRAYGYDERGNRLVTAQTNTGLSLNNPTAFNSNNQITGGTWEYGDERGNVTKDATSATMLYDAENRLVAYCGSGPSPCPNRAGAGRTLFQYDGEGRRVRRDSPASSSVYVYDARGQLAAEYGGTAAAVGRTYLTLDHLGSTRVVTDASQSATVRRDYLPFGEEIDATVANERWGLAGYGNDGGVAVKFTGKERDAETGLDYFGARYFSGAQGRFTSTDPHNIITEAASAEEFFGFLSGPQNWNRYAYARNNPLQYVDPDGRQVEKAVERLVQLASRHSPQLQRFGKFLERYGTKISVAVAEITAEVIGNHMAAEANAATLMMEHPGLTKVNALTAVSAPFGTGVVVAGPGGRGADVKLYDHDDLSGPIMMMQTEVKVTGLSGIRGNISAAAGQLGDIGGTVLLQLPNGTTAQQVQREIRRFGMQPGRNADKYRNIVAEVYDEDGNRLFQGGVQQ